MKSIFLSSNSKAQAQIAAMHEINPDLLDEVSGGLKCSCDGKYLTIDSADGVTSISVDDAYMG